MKNLYENSIKRIEKDIYIENKNILSDLFCNNRLDFFRFKSSFNSIISLAKEKDEELLDIFLSVKLHQALAEHDCQEQQEIPNNRIFDEITKIDGPFIFSSFHLGSYTIIPRLLLQKFKLVIVVNKKTFLAKSNLYKSLYENLGEKPESLQIIDAEKDNSILSIIKRVKQGYSLMFYIDGNTGIGGFNRKDEKLVKINFLRHEILSRKGIAFLSYKLNIPIIPIYTYREDNRNYIHIDPVITKENIDAENIESFSKKCTQLIWSNFETILLKNIGQWEGWLYLYNFFPKMIVNNFIEDIDNDAQLYISNYKELFVKNKRYYVYDLFKFIVYEVSEFIFTILKTMKNNDIIINFNEAKEIISKETLIYLITIDILTIK